MVKTALGEAHAGLGLGTYLAMESFVTKRIRLFHHLSRKQNKTSNNNLNITHMGSSFLVMHKLQYSTIRQVSQTAHGTRSVLHEMNGVGTTWKARRKEGIIHGSRVVP